MLRVLFASAALALTATAATAQAPARPKLLVAISVDQFSADLFAEYRAHFTGGLKRLSEGVVFPSGYQSHAATETCPGHSTILSGIRPARSGIAANDWFGMRRDSFDEIYCVENEAVTGSTHDNYTVSLAHLSGDFQTLGDRLKADQSRKTRVFAVSGKDRGATLMAGRNADQTWWYDYRARGFTTYVDKRDAPVDAVIPALKSVNARVAAWIAKPVAPPPLPMQCTARVRPLALGTMMIGAGVEAMPRTDSVDNTAKDFRPTRALDIATLDIAESMIAANALGRRDSTDVLAISLSATDYIGHAYGTEGPEMCAQLVSLDGRLAQLFARLDKAKVNYLVALTADHGGFDAPERNEQRADPAAERVKSAPSAKSLSEMIATKFGLAGKLVENRGLGGDYYFTPAIPVDRRAEIAAWLQAALREANNPEIAAVVTKADMAKLDMPNGNPQLWTLEQRIRASFVPDRSGDIYIALRNGVMGIPQPGRGYVATHGSPWDYDRRVPILFWWKGVQPFEQPNPVETVDILPTLAPLVGLSVAPASVDGECRDLDAGAGSTCP